VTALPDGRIVVEAPGESNLERLKAGLTATEDVALRLVDPNADPQAAAVGEVPAKDMIVTQNGRPLAVERTAIVTGMMVTRALSGFSADGTPDVQVTLDPVGAQRLAAATAANVGRQMAVVVGGDVIAAPQITAPITGGELEVTGQFTPERAGLLADAFAGGFLPAGLRILDAETVAAP